MMKFLRLDTDDDDDGRQPTDVERRLDRLAELLHEPLAQLSRILASPVAVVIRGGEPVFDSFTLNDLVPVQLVTGSATRRAITVANATAAGGANLVLSAEPITSPSGAGLFTLPPQSSVTFSSRRPLWVRPSAAGALVSLMLEEDPEQ